MGEIVTDWIAQSFRLTGAQVWKTTDDRGGPTDRTVAAGWYRTLLAPTAGAATEADPAEILNAIEAALGASHWSVTLGTDGRVVITYLGTGTGTITTAGGGTLLALIGFTTSTFGPLSPNATVVGEWHPTHCLLSIASDPDSGWSDHGSRFAGATLPDGSVYGWADGTARYRRTLTLRWHPRDSTLWSATGVIGTPAFSAASRLRSPSTSEPAQVPPWAITDTLATALGRSLGVALGTAQAHIAGTATTYDLAYLTPEHASAQGRIALSLAGYDARRDVTLELSYAGQGSR
jgi:hypothetical protein